MRIAALVLSLAALTGCGIPPTTSAAPSGAERCVSAEAISGHYVEPPGSIIFEMLGPVNYRNMLARPCPDLARLGRSAAIVFETSTSGRICAGDRVRLFDARGQASNRLSGPVCELGGFVPSAR